MSPAAAGAAPSPAGRVSPARSVPHHELPHRPHPAPLSVVRTRPGPARAPFVIMIAALVVGGLVALLLLNTALTQGAFERKAVSRELKNLIETQQGLREHIAAVQEPGALAIRARRLGLVASTCPVFLRLPAVTVLGTPCPARAPAKPKPAVLVAPDGKTATPAAVPPVTGKPGTPVAGKPVAGKPVAGKPVAGKPVAGKPVAGKPVAGKPVTKNTHLGKAPASTAKAPR